jgi:transposase
MTHEIYADYTTTYLLPPGLEDWIPADHPARFIRAFVEQLDLKAIGFRTRKAATGRPNYSSDLLLKVWLYGWQERISSARGLERACGQHLPLIWLTGQNYPDHNTLWRFWRDNQEALRAVFRESVRLAAHLDLVDFVLHAVDGSKVVACSSRRRALHREDLEKVLGWVDEQIDAMASRVSANGSDGDEEGGGYRLPEELSNAGALKQRVKAGLELLDKHGQDHLQPGEPEARMMKAEHRKEWGYNAQAVADESSSLIVACDVVNHAADNHELVGMIEQVEENLGAVAETTVADAGYENGRQLAMADAHGYNVLVHSPQAGRQGRYHLDEFTYVAGRDEWICPQRQRLVYTGVVTKRGMVCRRYACRTCKGCPVHDQCTKPAARVLEVQPHYQRLRAHRQRNLEPEARQLLDKRKTVIEPRFGWIKQTLGLRRWTVRGLANVKTQWALACTTWNLRRMWQLVWGKPRLGPRDLFART